MSPPKAPPRAPRPLNPFDKEIGKYVSHEWVNLRCPHCRVEDPTFCATVDDLNNHMLKYHAYVQAIGMKDK